MEIKEGNADEELGSEREIGNFIGVTWHRHDAD